MTISIANDVGEVLGFIAEEPRGLLASFSRQLLKTHRPFRAVIMDREGTPVLWVGVQCLVGDMSAHSCAPDPEAFRLDKFSHVRPKAQGLA
jgi:hypothetical protein